MWFPWYINTTKGTIMNKIRRWVLIYLISNYVLGVIWITVWIVDTRWNICIFPFTYYYMPRRRSVLSNCICFVIFSHISYKDTVKGQNVIIIIITVIITAVKQNLVRRVDILKYQPSWQLFRNNVISLIYKIFL